MLKDHESYTPLTLDGFEEDGAPSYTLSLTDAAMEIHTELLEAHGRIPNGYAFADVALQVMRTQAPELEERVEMDPEAGTFVAYGPDLEALTALAGLLHAAFHDRDALDALVAGAPWEYD